MCSQAAPGRRVGSVVPPWHAARFLPQAFVLLIRVGEGQADPWPRGGPGGEERRKGRSGVGLTRGRSPGQLIQPDRAGMSWEELGPYNTLSSVTACPPAQPPSFLPLSALFSSLPPFAGSPALIKCSVSSESARLPPCCSCLHAALKPKAQRSPAWQLPA